MEDDQSYRELPSLMQSMIQWMNHQMKSCPQPPKGRQAWVRKKEDIHPEGEWTHLVIEDTHA
jgi:hypothetical protein